MSNFIHRWITRPWVICTLAVSLAAVMAWGAGPIHKAGPSVSPAEMRALT